MKVNKVSNRLENKINEIKSTITYLKKDIDNIQNTITPINDYKSINYNYDSEFNYSPKSEIRKLRFKSELSSLDNSIIKENPSNTYAAQYPSSNYLNQTSQNMNKFNFSTLSNRGINNNNNAYNNTFTQRTSPLRTSRSRKQQNNNFSSINYKNSNMNNTGFSRTELNSTRISPQRYGKPYYFDYSRGRKNNFNKNSLNSFLSGGYNSGTSGNKYNNSNMNIITNLNYDYNKRDNTGSKLRFDSLDYDSNYEISKVDINKASTEILIKQIQDLRTEVHKLKNDNRALQGKLMNISTTEFAKTKLNNLENEVDDLNFEGKCISTIKQISEILNVDSVDHIIPKFKKYLKSFNHEKIKDEFLRKITSIYCNVTLNTSLDIKKIKFDSTETHIKSLWHWFKELVRRQTKSKNRDLNEAKNISVIKTIRNDKYRDFCKDLMMNLEILEFDEFKSFILALLNKYARRSKMNKTKRLLSHSPQYHKN